MKLSFPGATSGGFELSPHSGNPLKLVGSVGSRSSESSTCPYPSLRLFNLKSQQCTSLFIQLLHPGSGEQKPRAISLSSLTFGIPEAVTTCL